MIADQRGRVRRERAEGERAAAVERITAAARALLREHSVFELSAATVASLAETTRQTVHNYFPSMHELIFALADDLTVDFQTAGSDLDVDDPQWPYLYAERVANVALADPVPNRQVLLVSASQGRGMAAATSETNRQVVRVLNRRNPMAADKAAWLTLTLFRGTLFTWAAEQLSDDELRSNMRDVADVVVTQREIWNKATTN